MSSKHSAAPSLLGYLYQCRYALLRALQEAKTAPGLAISIEKFDDVAFESSGAPQELIQAKHHVNAGNVSDDSVDLWKTLAVWIDFLKAQPSEVANLRFTLLTTAVAKENSALSMLRSGGGERDEAKALELLEAAAAASKNKVTEKSRDEFLGLSKAQKALLVSLIWVFDAAPTIIDVQQDIESMLHYSAAGHASTMTSYLEGWWFGQVIASLSGQSKEAITLLSVQNKVFELAEGFKLQSLPLHGDIEASEPDPGFASAERVFVKQVQLVQASSRSISIAARDYYRAFTQRSRWSRQSLLLDDETERFERALLEAWEKQHSAACEDTAHSDHDAKCLRGREVLRWAQTHSHPLRGRSEIWLVSGSFHMLSDQLRLGWHPDYGSLINPEGS